MQEQQGASQDANKPDQVQLSAAIAVLQQLTDWRLQHREHMSADVLRVMDESSDDESTVAEGSQVNETPNASS